MWPVGCVGCRPWLSKPSLVFVKQLTLLANEIENCRLCPRLVSWREQVAIEKRLAFRDETYWGKPVPGFGDPAARLLVVGLAPAAHGANRTGRMFTGDRSGDWLYRSMHSVGYANQPNSTGPADGLVLDGAWVTSPVRCAPPQNKPSAAERDNCRPFFVREVELLTELKVIVALGAFGYAAVANALSLSPRPKFGHGVQVDLDTGVVLLCSYHVSQQNTFTGRLTEPMLD